MNILTPENLTALRFTTAQVQELTGLSPRQLNYWRNEGIHDDPGGHDGYGWDTVRLLAVMAQIPHAGQAKGGDSRLHMVKVEALQLLAEEPEEPEQAPSPAEAPKPEPVIVTETLGGQALLVKELGAIEGELARVRVNGIVSDIARVQARVGALKAGLCQCARED